MRTSIYKLAAVSALALSAGLLAMPQANAASLLSHNIVIAQAQTSDPGSRPGDAPGTMQTIPAPGTAPTYNNSAPRAGAGQGASGQGGDRAGDTAGSTPAVPAPATTTDRANSKGGEVTSDPGSRKGDVAGSSQSVPLTGGAVQCQTIVDMADRQACISRTQSGQR
jgi:hypothetical protein